MVTEVRIYVEGGGDGKDTKAQLREGFAKFLAELVQSARDRRTRWNIIACGSRQAAYDHFVWARQSYPETLNILLVDSEGPVTVGPWQHVGTRDNWASVGASASNLYLMTQLMESWLVADAEALQVFYGNEFNPNPIPKQQNIEAVGKSQVMDALLHATRNTQKGEYHKSRHAPKLLALVRPAHVRARAADCNRLFTDLKAAITS